MKDLENESFNPVSFIEQIASRSTEKHYTNCNDDAAGKPKFDVVNLEIQFTNCMNNMKLLHSSHMKKCQTLKTDYAKTQETYVQNILHLQSRFNTCHDKLGDLDNKVNNVAMKIMHLGSQLESVNIPRLRAVEAHKLMSYFSEFLGSSSSAGCPDNVDALRDDIRKMNEVADIIRKLFLISQELPDNKFDEVKRKINAKYDEIERILIEEFVKAQCADSLSKMSDIARVLSHFKGYSQCIDAFIEQSQAGILVNKNIFEAIVPICDKNFKIIADVFQNPEQVNAKFVLNIYQLKLNNYIGTVLSSSSSSDAKDSEKYLHNLTELYEKLTGLSNVLKTYNNLGNDHRAYLDVLSRNIFHKYLDSSYLSTELKHLKDKYATILHDYYSALGHQKKQNAYPGGGFQGFRRELQAAIGTRANINIAQIEDYGGEIFLSDRVTKAILTKSKEAFKRCALFFTDCTAKNTNSNAIAAQIFEVLLACLIGDYVSYAVTLGVNSIPLPELKGQQPPDVYFFNVADKATGIANALEKHFADDVAPLIGTDFYLQDCLTKKDVALADVEEKLDAGIDSTLNTIVGWIKIYLQLEQKKTDFKPELDIDIAASAACRVVVQYLQKTIRQIKDCLDGKNLQNVLVEVGVRFHRTIYEHLLQYTYNESGALCAICDVNEYKKCVKDLNFPLTNTLFDTLHALCNLLLVKPENLEAICSEQVLAVLDNNILLSFIQLRSDIKSLKLSVNLKGIV